jgi:sugar lactone lactonase YvrE
MNHFQLIADCQDCVGESPVWDTRAQRLWWVDIEGPFIRCCKPGSDETLQSWVMPERVGCIALTDVEGQLVAAMETGIAIVTLHKGGGSDCQLSLIHI